MHNRNRNKMLGIFALGLWILVSIQEVSCKKVKHSKPDTLPISLVSTSLGLSSIPSTTPIPNTTPGIFEEYISRVLNGKPKLYIDVWKYLHASDDEIANLKIEKVFLTSLNEIKLSVVDGKLIAKRIKKQKGPGNKTKEVEEVVTVRNLAKKNSHTKILCLQYPRESKGIVKDMFRIHFGEELEMERLLWLLLSLAHHYFDSLEVIYLSLFQGASRKIKAVFKEKNIKIEGGMPTLKTLFIRGQEFEPEGYVSDSYLVDPVLIKTKYVLKNEDFNLSFDEASKAVALGCSDSQHSTSALTLNVETIRQKLDSAKCELCNSPFKDQKTGKYSKRIFITKCHKLFHYNCLHTQVLNYRIGDKYNTEICCKDCNIFICTRRMYYKVVRNKDANETMKHSLVLTKFGRILWDKEVEFDKRPNYTIQVFLGPVVPSNAITESPAIGSENPINQEAETSL